MAERYYVMDWKRADKPDGTQCPRRFCFFWGAAQPGEATHCGCSFGICKRLDPEHGNHDWSESYEPELERAGLPWFYFIPSPEKLVDELRDGYVAESQALWGEGHWL